jgi:hypothetical protein
MILEDRVASRIVPTFKLYSFEFMRPRPRIRFFFLVFHAL